MTKTLITVFSSFLFVSVASAQATERIDNNSLPKATLEIQAINSPEPINLAENTHYNHENEKNNSLARGALARQGVEVNIRISSNSQVNYSGQLTTDDQNNSFYRSVLAK